MNDHPPVPPGEDVLTLPDEWRRVLHPRRGGAAAPEPTVDAKAPGAAARLIARSDGVVEALLDAGRPAAEVDGAVRRHLGGTPDPVGAAVIAALAMRAHEDARTPVWRTFVDAWTAEHGVGFAGRAVLEWCRTAVRVEHGGEWRGRYAVHASRDDGRTDRPGLPALRRVRSLLAAAEDAEQERLDAHRTTDATRLVAAYLVPNRHDWVEESIADPDPRSHGDHALVLLLASAGTVDQLRTAVPLLFWGQATRELLGTLADGVGPDVLEYFLENLDGSYLESRDRDHILQAVALLPSDAAFDALLDRRDDKYARRALADALRRFPVRAMRLLAARGLDDLLADHVRTHAETAVAALPSLPEGVRAVVEPLTEASARVPDALAADVPPVLVSPPWETPVPKVVRELPAPPVRTSWPDGVRDAWLAADTGRIPPPARPDREALAEAQRAGGVDGREKWRSMLYGPADVARPLASDGSWLTGGRNEWAKVVIARFGEATLDGVLRRAEVHPDGYAHLLLPFLSPGVAEFMCARLARNGAGHRTALEWFDRHGLDAVPYVAVRALGKAVKKRQDAERALRHLAARHGADAAASACPDGADALRAILSAHPVQTGLVERPQVGAWADPSLLPQVLLKDRRRALPAGETRNLIELTGLPGVSHHLDEAVAALDPGSLAEFGRALFHRWRDAGAISKESWALTQLGLTGDDETVRMLTPVIRAWPGEGGHRFAVAGLDVLAGIGTDLALSHLHSISQKVKFKALRQRALEKVREVADGLGLTSEQLADRLVPTFGLDAEGSMTLDYGPRRFTVGFTERLAPLVADESGRVLRALPKPGVKDDPELAPAAYKAFAALKKDVRGVVADLVGRLERALVAERRWTPDEFRAHLAAHPLVGHLVRRLVWVAEGDGGTAAFRVAEDGTFADVDDARFVLPESARVGVAHPLHLGDSLGTWREVFADYEILQPFEQLARPVHALTEEERESGRLERFEGLDVPFGAVLALVRRGWERGAPQDAGVEEWISRSLPGERHLVIDLDPGIAVGAVDATGDTQRLETVRLAPRLGDHRRSVPENLRFGDLSPVTASEILTDLTALADAGG
ncbi:DUF4132 domain-containing protein [Actinomadura sp. LOL_016]|uniref:DUF4132 domain-containing protein n=1 Tax=unclassified Actinomadura TaxID=2626254 RepID=UPI003A7FDED2